MHAIVERVAALYGNPSPTLADACYQAGHDRPAFWIASEALDAAAWHVAWLATAGLELHEALDRFATDMDPPRIELLDALVPLNHKAVLALRMAYMSVGQYPSLPSLHARTEKRQ